MNPSGVQPSRAGLTPALTDVIGGQWSRIDCEGEGWKAEEFLICSAMILSHQTIPFSPPLHILVACKVEIFKSLKKKIYF